MNKIKRKKKQYEAKDVFELLGKLEKLLRFNYEYHKHLTTLSAGSILIIIAILEGIFKEPEGIIIILSSIVCFVLALMCSLITMSMMGSITAKTIGIHTAIIRENRKKIQNLGDKVSSAVRRSDVIDGFTRVFFFLGMATLVLFAFINFL